MEADSFIQLIGEKFTQCELVFGQCVQCGGVCNGHGDIKAAIESDGAAEGGVEVIGSLQGKVEELNLAFGDIEFDAVVYFKL